MTFKRNRFIQFVVVSLLLHSSFVLTSFLMQQPVKPLNNNISIELLSDLPATTDAKTEGQKKKKVEDKDKRIVEQEVRPSTEEAPDTRFLSAQNQKVEKETVSKNRGEFKNNKKNLPATAVASDSPKKISLSSLAPKLGKTSVFDESTLKKEMTPEESSEAAAQAASGGSATQDYLKDTDQGLETLLNTREFKYYTYYNRIRKQLSHHWEPKVRVKLSRMFKQGRYLASATDRVTKLIVILDKKGNLVNVQMVKDSGVTDLDDAAIEAFQSAAPFPNPPIGIVEPDGTVKIRWDFVLES